MQNRRELGELLDDGGSLTKRRRASESDESPTPASDTFENSTVPLAASALGNDQDDSGSDWMDIMNEPTDSLEDPPAGLLVEGDDVPKLSGQVVRNSVISQVWSPDVGKVVGNEAPKGIEATYEWLQFLQDGCGGGGDGNAFALDCPSDWAANSTTRVRPAAFRSAAQQPISSSASLTVDSSSDEAEVTGAHKARDHASRVLLRTASTSL